MSRISLSVPVSVTAPTSGVPAWFNQAGFNDKTWAAVAVGTTLQQAANAAPSDGNGLAVAFMGAEVDQNTGELCLPAIGGHTDGPRNAVYALAMKQGVPSWTRIKQQTAASQSGDLSDSWTNYTYSDGSPRACHAWNAIAWGNGYFVHTSMQGMAINGNPSAGAFSLNRSTLQWQDRGLAWPSRAAVEQGGDFEGSSGCYDPVHNRFYIICGLDGVSQQAYYLDGTTWTFTKPGPTGAYPSDGLGRCAFNWCQAVPEYNYIVAGDQFFSRVGVLDTTTQIWYIRTIPPGAPVGNNSGVWGYRPVYHQPSHALLFGCKNEGSSILKLNCPANGQSGSFSWSTVAAAGGIVPPNVSGDQPHGRFNIINDIGNGRSVLVYYRAATDTSVYVYKLPVGALT